MATIKKSPVKKAQNGAKTKDSTAHFKKMQDFHYKQASTAAEFGLRNSADEHMRSATKAVKDQFRQGNKGRSGYDKNGYPVKKKMKAGGMIKRADGSMSKRGLWDNIRANKGSGKKPTAEMLKQERKIKKAQTGGSLGTIYTGPAKTNPGVLKAKADKMKVDANIAAYKKKIKSKK